MITLIDIKDIPDRNLKWFEITQDIERFLESDSAAAEIKIPEGRNAQVVSNFYRTVAGRNNFRVKIVKRKERVFLVREKF